FQAEDGIRDFHVTGVQTCALPIFGHAAMERHLAALEAALVRIARARLRALVAAAGRLAVARSRAPADALLRELGPARGLEIIQRSEERRVGEESECLSAIPLVDYH